MAQKLKPQQQSGYGFPEGSKTVFPSPIVSPRTPATTDTGYALGQLWVNTTTNAIYGMTGCAAGAAVWSLCSPGASDVDTINALSPVAGNITIAGGTNLTDVNGGNTVTLNLDNAITLATSVTSPLYTSGAGVDVQVTAPAGQDIILQMGDGAGANKVSFTDSTAAEVFSIDSNGTFGTLVGLTVTGALTQTAGVVNIGQDNAANAINIGGGTTARAIGIGNSAAAHILTLGSTTGVARTTLQSGTGDLILTSTNRITADSVGVLELNSSGAAIGIGNDADNFAVNVGTAGVRTVTVGSGTGASSTVINCGTGALHIGTNATVHTTTVGSTAGASATIIQAGTGKIDFASVVAELTADFIDVSGEKTTFRQSPILQSNATTGVAPTGATGNINIMSLEKGIFMEQYILGAGQTIICPRADTVGINVSGDLTATEGFEYNWGAGRANSKHAFTIGTSPAFFLEWRFRVADVSGVEPCYIGFRKTQANQVAGAIASYTDFVGYGLNDGISPGDCAISTQLNTGGLTNTYTNDAWADGTTHTLRVLVSAAGVVTFFFDGAHPTVTQAFTFDNGDVVHPFWRHEYNAAAPGAIAWVSMECGYQV